MEPPLPSQLCLPRPRPWHWPQVCPHLELAWVLLLERHELASPRRRLLVVAAQGEALQAPAARSRPSSEAPHLQAMAALAAWWATPFLVGFLAVLAEDEDFLLCLRRPWLLLRHRAPLWPLAEDADEELRWELYLAEEERCQAAPCHQLGLLVCLLV